MRLLPEGGVQVTKCGWVGGAGAVATWGDLIKMKLIKIDETMRVSMLYIMRPKSLVLPPSVVLRWELYRSGVKVSNRGFT